ncbi:tetratricopeptide repeat protein [Geitlerinema calcuttense]|uniref:Tetratricopeptide repeat protein n=1 Tax=Geitlerinema calcuttense NRMC-F 0142 TaxID=2922238 RepID=A0ABT7LVL3_9CYAN|nr:tetratricopeptide repeat protein [Geitlerinema calcuttense]MDL5056077.1 tetratricopeptide repeat protein [Geitlerinema calcuttense NRMC-F 0142]
MSHGPIPKKRVKLLVEALLDYEQNQSDRISNLKVSWAKNGKPHLVVNTTLQALRYLVGDKDGFKPTPNTSEKQLKNTIGEHLNNDLGKFLEILEDHRGKETRGSENWNFTLKLWSKDNPAENLQKLENLWQTKQSPQSLASSPPTETSPVIPTAKRDAILCLERLPEVPVWVGREELVEALKAKILAPETSPKVVALIGQGGIGKTSLAVKLLEALGVKLQSPGLAEGCVYDSALYFKVSQGSSFDDVAAFLLEALGVETAELLKTAEAKIAQILAALTEKRCLLVLDNLEDILYPASHREAGKAVSSEWGELLYSFAHSRHCSTIIITSREFPYDLTDRRSRNPKPNPKLVEVCTVGGVADEDGVEILRQNDSQDCQADLEWIAERVKGNAFILTQLAAIGAESPGYLRKHPELVTEEAEQIIRAQLERQSEAARELLKRMCVLRVGIDVQGLTFLRLYTDDWETDARFELGAILGKVVEFAIDEIKETEDIIKRLANSSLAQRRYDKERCEYFYDLHRLIGEFLQTEYKTELPQLLERVYKFYCTGKSIENPKTLEDLYPVLEAQYFAFKLRNYKEASILLIGRLEQYLKPWGYWYLLEKLYKQILPFVDKDKQPFYLQALGEIYQYWGRWKIAESYYRDALDIAKRYKDKFLIASSLALLGNIEYERGNWAESECLFRQSLHLQTELEDRSGIASSWGQLGNIERSRGNCEEAERLFRQSLQLRTELGDRSGMATSWLSLGDIEHLRGNLEEAKCLYHRSLQLQTELNNRFGIATCWENLGYIESCRGNRDEAERLFRQTLQLRTELGDRSGMATSWGQLGDIERKRGNWDEAERLYCQHLDVETELGDRYKIAEINYDLAQLWRKRGNPETAQEYYTTAQQLYQKLGAVKDLERIEREWNSPE